MVAMNVWPTDAADGSVATEARWRKMGRLWAPSGVAAGVGLEMAQTLAFPNLTVRSGACWVDGHFCELTGDQVLAVTANGLVVVRFDPAANTAELLYRDGVTVPAQSPTGTWELPIAQITGSALIDRRWLLIGGPTGPGPISYTSIVANTAAVSVATVIAALNTPVLNVPARRRLKITLSCRAIAGTPGNSGGVLSILENGAAVAETAMRWDAVGAANGILMQSIRTLAAGTYGFAAYMTPPGGGTIQVLATAAAPAFLLVEDIGLAP